MLHVTTFVIVLEITVKSIRITLQLMNQIERGHPAASACHTGRPEL